MILKKGNINYTGIERLNSGEFLPAGEFLNSGESLVSTSKKHKLTLLPDGNLVLYAGFKFLWHSNTAGSGAEILTMQTDGNLTLKDSSGAIVWQTNTSGSNFYATIQNDGNFVVYAQGWASQWSTRTYGNTLNDKRYIFKRNNKIIKPKPYKLPSINELLVNQSIEYGKMLISSNRRYILINDSNKLKKIDMNNSNILWEIETSDAVYLTLQGDGNLVFKNESGVTKWHSSTVGFISQNFKVILEDNGDLNQYDNDVFVRTITSGYYLN